MNASYRHGWSVQARLEGMRISSESAYKHDRKIGEPILTMLKRHSAALGGFYRTNEPTLMGFIGTYFSC